MWGSQEKNFGAKSQCKIFHGDTLRGGHLNSEKPVGFCYPACMYGSNLRNLALTFCPTFFS